MDPILIPTIASIVLRILESINAGRKPEVTDAELDLLRRVSQGKLDDFLRETETPQ